MSRFNANVNSSVIEESMQSAMQLGKKSKFDTKNYLDTSLKDGENERTVTIRILPITSEDGNFRIAVKTHNLKVSRRVAQSGFKSFLCLNDRQIPNYNESTPCPICAKAQELFDAAAECRQKDPERSKSLFKKACSLKNKVTYIVRVIERGKEDEGVKFWRFNENTQGKGIYDALMNLYKLRKKEKMEDSDIPDYNIFDLENGHDIVLTLTRTVRSDGKEGVSINVTDRGTDKPLTKDTEQGNAWINDEKKWYDCYVTKPADYLKIVANDMIPYFDKVSGTWVPRTEEDFKQWEAKKLEREQSYADDAKAIATPVQTEEDDEDLPF